MITKPRGTVDLFADKARMYTTIKELISLLMNNYNYQEIITPTFESEVLFTSGVGQETDIVSKEMYSFFDRKNRPMVLRPEFTAPVVRAVIENKLYINQLPLKLFYFDKCFRYERPQKGRQREFWQFGIEVFGVNSYLGEIEAVQILANLFTILAISTYKIRVNFLLTNEAREKYISTLKAHLQTLSLCDECQVRIEKNTLRVLDCKLDVEKLKKVPKMSKFRTKVDNEKFQQICKLLAVANIDVDIDEHLVRGLDYYTGFIFEVDLKGSDGKILTVAGGGRYDGLVAKLGGPDLSSVGFGLGLERLFNHLEEHNLDILAKKELDVYLIGLTEQSRIFTNLLSNALRIGGVSCEINHDERSLKASFKYSEQIAAKSIVVIGDDEVKSNIFKIKDQTTKAEKTVNGFQALVEYFIDKKEK